MDLGGFWVLADLRTPLGLSLYRYGFCSREAQVCAALLRADDVCVDGGANVGLFSLRMAGAVGTAGRVLACEPAPGTMRLLRANVDRNGFGTLDLHDVALADEVGTSKFTVFEDGAGLSSFAPAGDGGHPVDVAVTTLDRLTAPFADRVALVKLDIEGAEAKALRGASDLITRAAPMFVLEVEPGHLQRQGCSIDDVMDSLVPYGYAAYAITSEAQLVKLDDRWLPPDPSSPNLVLAPPSRLHRLRDLVNVVGG